jgi:hypothetical protein
MRRSWTPSIVPRGDDQDIYLVMDDLGRVWREADVEATDFETVVLDLLEGQYKNPIGIFSFNPAEGCSRDVSEDVARELRQRGACATSGRYWDTFTAKLLMSSSTTWRWF